MKIFAYLRVSTKEQLDGGGFDRQLETVRSLCASRGWTIARTFRDQQSGGTEFEGRAGLQEILALAGECNALGIDTVVVENASRIARDLMVQEIFLSECRKKGIKIFAADCGEELVMAGADPTRVLIRQILGALAQWEKSQTVLKLQAGRRKRAQETGQPCGGVKAYGQTDAERAVLADIVKYRKMGWSFLKVARYLHEVGYPTPGNFPSKWWHSQTVSRLFKREESRKSSERAFEMDNDT